MPTHAPSAALMGAYVADAAALGLHWIYDPSRIAAVAARFGGPAFVPIDPAHYEDVPAYFAHGQRRDGMLSQYGECLRLAVETMTAAGGGFEVAGQQAAFAAHFGMGGRYLGYIDRPTRAAVIRIGEDQSPSGSDDDQLPALTRIPAVVVAGGDESAVQDAIAITNVNDDATAYGAVFADLLRRVLSGEGLQDALSRVADGADGDVGAAITAALATDEPNSVAYGEVTGRACHLKQGVPLAFHIMARADGFADAVTRNIMAGGDSCGRSIVIGAVMAAAGGMSAIPDSWLLRLQDGAALLTASDLLASFAKA